VSSPKCTVTWLVITADSFGICALSFRWVSFNGLLEAYGLRAPLAISKLSVWSQIRKRVRRSRYSQSVHSNPLLISTDRVLSNALVPSLQAISFISHCFWDDSVGIVPFKLRQIGHNVADSDHFMRGRAARSMPSPNASTFYDVLWLRELWKRAIWSWGPEKNSGSRLGKTMFSCLKQGIFCLITKAGYGSKKQPVTFLSITRNGVTRLCLKISTLRRKNFLLQCALLNPASNFALGHLNGAKLLFSQ